jgi:hypothetical protein
VPPARETIFKNLFVRNSLGTNPKTRVAKGFNCLFTKTTEFWLKETEIPEFRFNLVFVFTITAYKTSPFFTFEVNLFFERIFCTETTITSPILP